MKITAITQQKKDSKRYNIFIDGEFAFGIDGVDMLYYKLKEGEELSDRRYDELMTELVYIKAREAAMRYLGFKNRTEKEVRDKLAAEYPVQAVERVIEQLKKYKIIDDNEYAKMYINDCLRLKGWGERRILEELRRRGISRETAEPYLDDTADTMLEKAEALLLKRIKTDVLEPKEYKKQMDFLLRRGFDISTAKEALKKYKNDY